MSKDRQKTLVNLDAYHALQAAKGEAERSHTRAWRAAWHWNIDNGATYVGRGQ